MDTTKVKFEKDMREICLSAIQNTFNKMIRATEYSDKEYGAQKRTMLSLELMEKMNVCQPYFK